VNNLKFKQAVTGDPGQQRQSGQRRSQNEAEEAMAPTEKNLLRFFAGVLYQSQLFENKRKEQSDSCGVVFSHWPRFNVTFCDCETIRLKHATLLAKLPINADNTSWGVAWMKCKGAAFLKKSTNSDETFLRWLFAWSIAETSRNILGQDIINPKRITQWSVM